MNEIIIGNKKNLEDAYNNVKAKIEALKIKLENKDTALVVCVIENSTLKMSIDDKQMQCFNESSKTDNRQNRKLENVACYIYGVKGHMPYKCCYIKHDSSLFKKIWVPKCSNVLSNHKGPIKVRVPYFFQTYDSNPSEKKAKGSESLTNGFESKFQKVEKR